MSHPVDKLYDVGFAAGVAAERERCARIADEFVVRTNADIAHAIAAAIRQEK